MRGLRVLGMIFGGGAASQPSGVAQQPGGVTRSEVAKAIEEALCEDDVRVRLSRSHRRRLKRRVVEALERLGFRF